MKRKFFDVDDTFNIKNRGVVIVGFIESNSPNLRVDNKIEILRPDNTTTASQVAGIEMINRKCLTQSNERETIGFSVRELTKNDIPKGSTVFLIED